MITGPIIAEIAALVGDPARATMVSALLDGRALSASELAVAARITPQTASAHLAKLTEAAVLSLGRRAQRRARRCIGRARLRRARRRSGRDHGGRQPVPQRIRDRRAWLAAG